MSMVTVLLFGVKVLAGLVCGGCVIMVLIKMFHDEVNGGVGKGILGLICGLYAFIWGWQHVNAHDNKTVMLTWTASLVLGVTAQVALDLIEVVAPAGV